MARRVMGDSRSEAEKAFKSATTKPPELPAAPAPSLPGAKEMVSLRIDRDVLDVFQAEAGLAGPHQRGIAQSASGK